jgi:hypothetical protein
LDTGSSFQGEHLCFPLSLSLFDIFVLWFVNFSDH